MISEKTRNNHIPSAASSAAENRGINAFALDEVTLTDGLFQELTAVNAEVINGMSADTILYVFRYNANLNYGANFALPGPALGHWAEPGHHYAGHFEGHYVQIELCSALADVEAIAAVPGLSALMVGPSDLAMDLGVFPSQDDPLLLDAVRTVASAAAAHGLDSGVITANAGLIKAARCAGMNTICCGSELRLLTQGLKSNKQIVLPEDK